MDPAKIIDGWVVCPVCSKKQFPLCGNEQIKNLKYRCKTSRKNNEHFMMIDVEWNGK